jgi:hypothetical protein
MKLRADAGEKWDGFCVFVVGFSHESVPRTLMNPRDKALAFVVMIIDGVVWRYVLDRALDKRSGFLGKERSEEEPHEGGKEKRGYDDHGP